MLTASTHTITIADGFHTTTSLNFCNCITNRLNLVNGSGQNVYCCSIQYNSHQCGNQMFITLVPTSASRSPSLEILTIVLVCFWGLQRDYIQICKYKLRTKRE